MVAKHSGSDFGTALPAQYTFRRVFTPAPSPPEGCQGVWEVRGGRAGYQIVLEVDAAGRHNWHCTCPDATFRSDRFGRACKHVVALVKSLA